MIISASQTGANDGSEKAVSVVYLVETDGTDSAHDVLNSALIPQKGARLKTGSWLVCLSRNARAVDRDSRKHWEVTVEYGLRDAQPTARKAEGDSERLQSLQFGSRDYDTEAREAYFEDETELSHVANSAGDSPDPPVMMTVSNDVIMFTQNEEEGFDPEAAINFRHTINKTTIRVCGVKIQAGRGLMSRIDSRLQPDGTYRTDYEIELATAKPFRVRFPDEGFRHLAETGYPVETRMSDLNSDYATGGDLEDQDKPVSDPVRLNGKGGLLENGGVTVFREYRLYEQKDWSKGLNLVENRP